MTTETSLDRFEDEAVIDDLIRHSKVIAVIGLSPNPSRSSNEVARYLQTHGYRIIPVNPAESELLGEKCYARVSDIPFAVDIVDVFRRAEFVPAIAQEAVTLGAGSLWLQLGVISLGGAEIAKRGGLKVVMDRCLKVEVAARPKAL